MLLYFRDHSSLKHYTLWEYFRTSRGQLYVLVNYILDKNNIHIGFKAKKR